ncbi:MAG: response regulator [Alphaproteobacteria bacterium]
MNQSGFRILIVDDEPQIIRFLRTSLTANGYTVIEASTGQDAIKKAVTESPDAIMLDLGLPDMDGKEVIKALREGMQTPIVILSARTQESEKIKALDLGADDYIDKPFNIGELMARLRVSLRHKIQKKEQTAIFKKGEFSVDIIKRVVKRGNNIIHLTPKEYDLLCFLVQHAGKVLTHRQILHTIWGPAHTEDTVYLRVFIGQLRRKIEKDSEQPELILTESGVGYRLCDDMS